ncbi:MAG: hypothetical protein H6656_09755 [Ardenticatenaceae bacterium]|nr:hypothetical protein [Ardenticatenaceae bacterium]
MAGRDGGGAGRQTALLMLDEFEALERVLALQRFDEEIVLGMLRHLIQHRPKFKVLLPARTRWRSFRAGPAISSTCRWSISAICIRTSAAAGGKRGAALCPALRTGCQPARAGLTRGHPFLVQLLCAEIVALKNEQPRALASVSRTVARMWKQRVPEALITAAFFFADMRNQTDRVGRAGAADLLAAQAGLANASAFSVAGTRGAMGGVELSQTLRQLNSAKTHRRPHGDGLRFQIELVRRWFVGQG